MLATKPEVARPGGRISGDRRHRVGEILQLCVQEEAIDLVLIEARKTQIKIERCQVLQFGSEKLEVPIRVVVRPASFRRFHRNVPATRMRI